MEQIIAYSGTYEQYKQQLGHELSNMAEGFVRTGYLLKVARDTNILSASGYASVAEFAEAEYSLTKDIVSRYIAINDKFSEGGYSDHLPEKYRGYGVAKLQEMLTMPDPVIDLLSPDLTRKQLQDIKSEIREEEKISELEVMFEPKNMETAGWPLLHRALDVYFGEHKDEFLRLSEVIEGKIEGSAAVAAVMDTLAPSGIINIFVRHSGIGKIMITIIGEDQPVTVLAIRTNEKEEYEIGALAVELQNLYDRMGGKIGWEAFYGKPFDKPEEVAPVQPYEKAPEVINSEDVEVIEPEEQIPGQDNITEHPEWMPDKNPQTVEKTECESNFDSMNPPESENDMSKLPEAAFGQNVEPVMEQEEISSAAVEDETADAEEKLTEIQKILLEKAEKLRKNIREENWAQAIMDVKDIEWRLERVESVASEDEEDED